MIEDFFLSYFRYSELCVIIDSRYEKAHVASDKNLQQLPCCGPKVSLLVGLYSVALSRFGNAHAHTHWVKLVVVVLLVVNMAAHNSRSIPSGVSPPIVAFFSHVLLLLLLLLLVRFCVVRTPGFSVSGVSMRFLCVYMCVCIIICLLGLVIVLLNIVRFVLRSMLVLLGCCLFKSRNIRQWWTQPLSTGCSHISG